MNPKKTQPALVHIATVPESLKFLTGQIGFMQDHGLDVRALASPGPLLEEFGQTQHVPVYAVEMPRRITPLRDLQAIYRVWRRLRALRPAIVHSHTPKGGLIGMIAAWLARVPVRVYHIHGMPYLTATGKRRFLLRLSETVSCRLAHQVLCVSHSIREMAVRDGTCPERKIKVLAGGSINGIDATERFNPQRQSPTVRQETRSRLAIPQEATVIGFVGRLVRDKGVVELTEAWQALREAYPGLHLLMVGPLEPQDPVPASTIELLEQDPRVHLAGEDWNTPPLYAAMDLVALPTYREGLPLVPLEAAAMGLPIVATKVPGCTDAIEEDLTGLLVPPQDVPALIAALRAYLDDPGLRQKHGQAGRARVLQSFRQDVIWEATLAEYTRLLRARNLPLPTVGEVR